jgi:valyl-tRNA synthetase
VYLHGIVRDKQGRKFSKSLNNGIDPLELTAKYGTDALRIALVFGAAPGNDVIFDEQKVKGMKHFANKLWNIARFIMTNVETSDYQFEALTQADKTILEALQNTIEATTKNLDNFMLHEAAQGVYQFVWHELADVYLETSKEQLRDEKQKANTEKILLHQLICSLKLLHPFMPFITEHIWQMLKERQLVKTDWLMVAEWPKN